jgi:hypothetical protein
MAALSWARVPAFDETGFPGEFVYEFCPEFDRAEQKNSRHRLPKLPRLKKERSRNDWWRIRIRLCGGG